MPIEIRELVIRVSVEKAQPALSDTEALLAGLKQEVLEACDEKLEEISKRGWER